MTRLILNTGSTSIKAALFEGGLEVARAEASGIGTLNGPKDHAAALEFLLRGALKAASGASAAVHRIVHGGGRFTAPVLLTDPVLAELEQISALAPLHNPPALAAVRALAARFPDLPQVGCFDTAFFADLPEVARTYALPADDRAAGLRVYGFHGLSYTGLIRDLAEMAGVLPRRLLALHLGGGASACAILDGKPVATTMGFSPTCGLPMGSRAGDVDPLAVLDMARRHGIDGATQRLTKASGLTALGGSSDMRSLQQSGTPEAVFAQAHFVHWTLRHCGAMIAALGGIDAVAFTGGIGENDHQTRRALLDGLGWTGLVAPGAQGPALHDPASPVAAWIVPAREERTLDLLARDVLA